MINNNIIQYRSNEGKKIHSLCGIKKKNNELYKLNIIIINRYEDSLKL